MKLNHPTIGASDKDKVLDLVSYFADFKPALVGPMLTVKVVTPFVRGCSLGFPAAQLKMSYCHTCWMPFLFLTASRG
jgi:hypothetical protein